MSLLGEKDGVAYDSKAKGYVRTDSPSELVYKTRKDALLAEKLAMLVRDKQDRADLIERMKLEND